MLFAFPCWLPQVLTREYYSLQSAQEKRVLELEASLSESKAKLTGYERLEQELDEVVMQAADGKLFKDLNLGLRISLQKHQE